METTRGTLQRLYRQCQCSRECEKLRKQWNKKYGKKFVDESLMWLI